MKQQAMLALLQELLSKHGPPGDEREVDAVILREFRASGVDVWQDSATNIVAHVPGAGPKVMVAAHKDELGMIVTGVLDNGRLKVSNMGGAFPWKYGEGPIDVLADKGDIVRALLSVGSLHTRTGVISELRDRRALTWDMVTLYTGLTPEALVAKGVHIGSRAVVARERKKIETFGEMIASFALDDRMGLVSLIAALQEVAQAGLPLDLYFVATHGEEVGLIGAKRAAQLLQPEIAIALDTSPVTHDTPLVLDARPVIWYGERAYHNKVDCDTLLRLADELGFGAQPVVYDAAASDAGGIKQAGLAGRTVAFGFARDNSHGFEIAHPASLVHVTRLLIAYLKQL